MSINTMHSQYLRWTYAFGVMVVGLLIALLVLSDDEAGSHDNTGVWVILAVMLALFCAGYLLAPRLHTWFGRISGKKVQSSGSGKSRSSRKSVSRSGSRSEG